MCQCLKYLYHKDFLYPLSRQSLSVYAVSLRIPIFVTNNLSKNSCLERYISVLFKVGYSGNLS